MTRSARSAIGAVLASAWLAVCLLAFVGVWSLLATLVPQGDVSAPDVAAWASARPLVAPLVRLLGLHRAFGAPLFLLGVAALAVATAVCASRRTKVAVARTRTLREAAVPDGWSPATDHDLSIPHDPVAGPEEILARSAEVLEGLGVRTKRRGEVLCAVSPAWSVWGSPVFHWGLVAVVLALFVGGLARSEGLMGVAVGETKPDVPASYRVLQTGPLHRWPALPSGIRVSAFDTAYREGGIDRGPVPTVAVLDATGRVLKSQRVYPNHPLQVGSLTIHPADFGFAATLSVTDASGAERGRAVELIDISQEASGGTLPVEPLRFADDAGNELQVAVTVPMERTGGELSVPQRRVAVVRVTRMDGSPVADRVIGPGESVALPAGSMLRLDALGFYARLSVVDDPTIALLYGAIAVALAGLALVAAARQQLVLVTIVGGAARPAVVAKLRLWRNAPTSRDEIREKLTQALHGRGEDDAS